MQGIYSTPNTPADKSLTFGRTSLPFGPVSRWQKGTNFTKHRIFFDLSKNTLSELKYNLASLYHYC